MSGRLNYGSEESGKVLCMKNWPHSFTGENGVSSHSINIGKITPEFHGEESDFPD